MLVERQKKKILSQITFESEAIGNHILCVTWLCVAFKICADSSQTDLHIKHTC